MEKLLQLYTDINVAPLNMGINMEGWTNKWISNICGIESFGTAGTIVNDHRLEFAFGPSFFTAHKNIEKKLLEGTMPLKEAIDKSIEIGENLLKIFWVQKDKIESFNKEELASIFKHFFEQGGLLCTYGYLAPMTDFPELFLSNMLETILEKRDAKKEVVFLSQTSRKRPLVIAKEELLKTIIRGGNIKDWLDKWYWLEFGHFGPGYSIGHIREENSEYINDNNLAKEELRRIIAENVNLQNKQEERFKELDLNRQELSFFHQAQDISFLKAYRTDIINCINALFDIVFDICSIRNNISKEALRYLTKEELLAVILERTKIDESKILERKHSTIFLSNDNGVKVLVGAEAIKYIKENIEIPKQEGIADEIRGKVAFPGYVKGPVKIINSKEDLEKIEEGDILIAVQTTPELLPAMKKATAFVTDIGGITCHAAIVSREMKKPCIVGTKIATQILKDGDMVEVDADKGVVRIIK